MLEVAAALRSAADHAGSRCRILTLTPDLSPFRKVNPNHNVDSNMRLETENILEITRKSLKIEGTAVTLWMGCDSLEITSRIGV